MKKNFILTFLLFVSSLAFTQNFYVCLSSFNIEKNAIEFQKELKSNSIDSFIEKAISKSGEQIYRVILNTPNDTIEKARSLRDEIQKKDFFKNKKISGLWVLKSSHSKLESNAQIPLSNEKPYSLLIESYKEEQNANNDRDRLQKNDIDAYVLKKFKQNENFTFDIHAGSETDEKNLDKLKEKLDDLQIDYKTTNYNDFEDELKTYNEIVQTQDIVSNTGNNELPNFLSENIKELIYDFPINKDFQINAVTIFDVKNIIALAPEKNEFSASLLIDEIPNAFSTALYEDKLFDKSVTITIATYDNDANEQMNKLIEELKTKKDFIRTQTFAIKGGTLESLIFGNEKQFELIGISNDKKTIINLTTFDFTEKDFIEFVENFDNDSNLLIYPQIRKTLCILPNDDDNKFLCYMLDKIGMDYVAKRSYKEWAWGIFGHWNANFSYKNDKDIVEIGLFDLDYDYNASKIHKIFMDDKNSTDVSIYNHPQTINNKNGWFLKDFNSQELSFSNNTYIIAIATDPNSIIDEQNLIEIAADLKVW